MELGKTLQQKGREAYTSAEVASICYHDIFGYPLTDFELIKWIAGPKTVYFGSSSKIIKKHGFHLVGNDKAGVLKRMLRKRSSERKIKIAKKAASVLGTIPFVKMVGITGALAMKNAQEESDIDLLVVTKRNKLWTTRAISLLVLKVIGLKVRRFGETREKDKLCLNMWLDEGDLVFKKRNMYTAHELAQIVPLVNKGKTYELLLQKNTWIKDYWPNAVKVKGIKRGKDSENDQTDKGSVERIFWFLQKTYMRQKITNETVTPTRAMFHPYDWGDFVLKKLSS